MKRIYKHILPFLFFAIITCFYCSTIFAQQPQEQRFNIQNSTMKMSVYPMPAKTYVNIYLSTPLRMATDKVEIIDITGRKVLEQRFMDDNTNEFSFNNISTLPAGIYFIAARDKDGKLVQSAKMVISK